MKYARLFPMAMLLLGAAMAAGDLSAQAPAASGWRDAAALPESRQELYQSAKSG